MTATQKVRACMQMTRISATTKGRPRGARWPKISQGSSRTHHQKGSCHRQSKQRARRSCFRPCLKVRRFDREWWGQFPQYRYRKCWTLYGRGKKQQAKNNASHSLYSWWSSISPLLGRCVCFFVLVGRSLLFRLCLRVQLAIAIGSAFVS